MALTLEDATVMFSSHRLLFLKQGCQEVKVTDSGAEMAELLSALQLVSHALNLPSPVPPSPSVQDGINSRLQRDQHHMFCLI